MKYNRHTLPFIGAALLFATLFLFRLPVSRLLNLIIVEPLFADFERGILVDAILTIGLFLVVVWIAKEQRPKFFWKPVLYVLVFYFSQRTNSYWLFINTVSLPHIFYWDIVAFALSTTWPLSFLLHLNNKNGDNAIINDGFIEDNAVTRLEDDNFRRKEVASEIAHLIQLTPNKKSFGIGILGEYGSGKTSFLNLINLQLNESEVLKIAFDPWSAGSPETIRREFFDLLARKVADVDLTISSSIYSYGRKLASFDTRSLSLFNWLGVFRNQGTVQSSEEYAHINKMLSATHRKIVITIDDFDRLYPVEIMEVLKLVRNTAGFSNVFYLVGYDKAYVQGAMKTFSVTSGLDYMDKIFQLEIPLPKREEDDLLFILQEHLEKIISTEHYIIFENVIITNGFRSSYEKAYNGILRQGRDVVRFINGFKIVYKLIGEEVDFECLLVLELIKFRFPLIYNLIYTQADQFLHKTPVRATHEQFFSPRMVKDSDVKNPSNEVSYFKTYIEKLQEFGAEDIFLLDGLFMTLFKGRQYSRLKAQNSISYPLYFDVYFRYRLSHKDLSDKQFKAAMVSNRHMFEYMKYCASNGLHKELMVRLMQEDISKNLRHFEQVIGWIFSFGRTLIEKEGMFHFDYGALIDKIYNYSNIITDVVYKKDAGGYTDFIRHFFSNASPTYLFENELLYHLKKKGNNFVIPVNEMTAHQLSYFTRMAESGHGLSEDTLWLFWGARENYDVAANEKGAYNEHWRFEPDLVSKMKIYLRNKDPKEFLKFSIEHGRGDLSQVFIIKQVMEMFVEPAEYRKLVENNPALNDDIRWEYLELFDKLAATGFMQHVDMELKTELKKLNS